MDMDEAVRTLIGTRLEIEEDKITRETTFDELGADSLDIIEVVAEIENEYDIEISDEALGRIRSVGDIENLIDESL